MELLPDDLKGMKDLWADPVSRQKAKLVINHGLTTGTSLTVKEVRDVFYALDDLLITEDEDKKPKGDPAM